MTDKKKESTEAIDKELHAVFNDLIRSNHFKNKYKLMLMLFVDALGAYTLDKDYALDRFNAIGVAFMKLYAPGTTTDDKTIGRIAQDLFKEIEEFEGLNGRDLTNAIVNSSKVIH